METVKYDFSNFEQIMFQLKTTQNQQVLRELKTELNKFFKDSNCKEIIYTKNYDKLFFGLYVIPVINGDQAVKLLTSDEKTRIKEYYIEIDSKLLDPGLNLSAAELTAVLLHEVGHLTNDSHPADEIRKATDVYMAENNEHLILNSAKQYKELLAFAVKDAFRKLTSLFEFKKNEEILADEFVVRCGFGPQLESALNKIVKNSCQLNNEIKNKLMVLQWSLRLYKDVKSNRISALHALNRASTVTGSILQKREINSVSRNLQQIDDDRLITESITDIALGLSKNISDLYKSFKYKGIRALNDDYFDLAIRVKNVDEQEEALLVLRQINLRLSILDDYLRTEQLDPNDREKWMDLGQKYRDLRDTLSKKQTYADKYYGMFVKTPVIKSRFEV